jgi:hypothetical protein
LGVELAEGALLAGGGADAELGVGDHEVFGLRGEGVGVGFGAGGEVDGAGLGKAAEGRG